MRSFIAVDFSKEMKTSISNLQAKLKPYSVSGRWKYIDNFHLTLKFLDDINNDMVEKIKLSLESISKENKRFALNISGIDNFPGNGNYRVLWIGLGGEMDSLKKLQSDIDNGMNRLGFAKEKRMYVPHVTIAQDVSFTVEFNELVKVAGEVKFPDIPADKIHLFKSEQIGRKRVYTSVYECMLQK